MAKLRKRKTKTGYIWDIDFRANGKRIIWSTGTNRKEDAKKILDDIQAKIATKKFNIEEYVEKHMTISTFFEEYFKVVAVGRKPALLKNQKNYMRQFKNVVGDVDLKQIDAKVMDDYRSKRLPTVSPATFDIERRFLHAAFQFAVKWEYIDKNPIKHLKKEKVPAKKMYLTNDEKIELFKTIDSYGLTLTRQIDKDLHVLFKKAVIFLLNTGLRREELHQLSYSNIDLRDRKITVLNGTKGDKIRYIPLNDVALEIISTLDKSLFQSLEPKRFSKKFHKLSVDTQLKNIKLHSLRHTFATDLVEQGINIAVIQELLGHSDIRTTLEYAKVSVEVKRSAVDALNKLGNVTKPQQEHPTNILQLPLQKFTTQ